MRLFKKKKKQKENSQKEEREPYQVYLYLHDVFITNSKQQQKIIHKCESIYLQIVNSIGVIISLKSFPRHFCSFVVCILKLLLLHFTVYLEYWNIGFKPQSNIHIIIHIVHGYHKIKAMYSVHIQNTWLPNKDGKRIHLSEMFVLASHSVANVYVH